jgi:endonuclease-3
LPERKAAKKPTQKRAVKRKPAPLPPPPRGARSRALKAVERLRDIYPAATELEHHSPFEMLIATILSAQTTDKSVNLVTPALFERYPTAADLAAADPADVEKMIKPTGFFRAKTRSIISAARQLVDRYGGEVPGRLDELVTLPGIGRKTANVMRLTNRLGLVATRDPAKIERYVTKMVPAREWTGFSLRLILHGRRICVARRPRCEECVLNDFCPSSSVRPKRAAPQTSVL